MNKKLLWIIPIVLALIIGFSTKNIPLSIAVFIGTITTIGILYSKNEKSIQNQASISNILGIIIILTVIIAEFTSILSSATERAIISWMGIYIVSFSLRYQVTNNQKKLILTSVLIAVLTILLTYFYTL